LFGTTSAAELLAHDVVQREDAPERPWERAELGRAGRGVQEDLALLLGQLGDRDHQARAAKHDRSLDLVHLVKLGGRVDRLGGAVLGVLGQQLDRPPVHAARCVDLLDGELHAARHVDAGLRVGAGQVRDEAHKDRGAGLRRTRKRAERQDREQAETGHHDSFHCHVSNSLPVVVRPGQRGSDEESAGSIAHGL
jgi:hypothetical protein